MKVIGTKVIKKKGVAIFSLSFLLFFFLFLLVNSEKHEFNGSYSLKNQPFRYYSKIENNDIEEDSLSDNSSNSDNYFEKQLYQFKQKDNILKEDNEKKDSLDLAMVKERFSKYVMISDGVKLFHKNDKEYELDSVIHGTSYLELDDRYEIVDGYYKLLGCDLYVSYDKVKAVSEMPSLSGEYKYYKNTKVGDAQ